MTEKAKEEVEKKMTLTIFEVLQNAQYNLRHNGSLGMVIGMEQLNNAIEQLESGKGLDDEFEDDEE